MSSRDLLYYIGVHHKTGTVWMTQVHRAIGQRLGLPMTQLVESQGSRLTSWKPAGCPPLLLGRTPRTRPGSRIERGSHGEGQDSRSFGPRPRRRFPSRTGLRRGPSRVWDG